MSKTFTESIQASIDLKKLLLESPDILEATEKAANAFLACFRSGGKVLFCGNGGSAADAQHLAAELSGRFYLDRVALPAEALHANTSYLTAVANDYGYDEIYARLVKGIGKAGDILVGLSTSGNSGNIVHAFQTARNMGIQTVGFTGAAGGSLGPLSDIWIAIPSTTTPRIQECHMLLGHSICEVVEREFFSSK